MSSPALSPAPERRQPDGDAALLADLLHGCGLRPAQARRLRVKDIDLQRRQIQVTDGKRRRDGPRWRTIPAPLVPPLCAHLTRLLSQHLAELASGWGTFDLPGPIDLIQPAPRREWRRRRLFPPLPGSPAAAACTEERGQVRER